MNKVHKKMLKAAAQVDNAINNTYNFAYAKRRAISYRFYQNKLK